MSERLGNWAILGFCSKVTSTFGIEAYITLGNLLENGLKNEIWAKTSVFGLFTGDANHFGSDLDSLLLGSRTSDIGRNIIGCYM